MGAAYSENPICSHGSLSSSQGEDEETTNAEYVGAESEVERIESTVEFAKVEG